MLGVRRLHGAVMGKGRCASGGRGKSASSSRWIKRQKKDPFVKQANFDNYRSRSAYKLIELDDKFHFLRKGSVVIDCGARPGSWSQVAAKRVGTEWLTQEELLGHSDHNKGLVLAMDIEDMRPLPGVVVRDRWDVTSTEVQQNIVEILRGRKADVIMSDMAPNATGVQDMDHQRILILCEAAYTLVQHFLKDKGVFLCKQWQGCLTNDFKEKLKENFETVKECRLKVTRKESAEVFMYAEGYVPKISSTYVQNPRRCHNTEVNC